MLEMVLTATGTRVRVKEEIAAMRVRPVVNFNNPNRIKLAMKEFTKRMITMLWRGFVSANILITE